MQAMMKYLLLLVLFTMASPLQAKPPVDVYGTDPSTATGLLKKYSQRIASVESQLLEDLTAHGYDTPLQTTLLRKRTQLINEIKHDGPFDFIDLQTITYPEETPRYYTTLEVIMHNQPERLKLVQKKTQLVYKKKSDLIEKMTEYEQKRGELLIKNQFNGKKTPCPLYHCTTGFDHPELRPTFDLFNQTVPGQKALILRTLNHDPDPERRASAAFLVGHFTNPQEILTDLTPHVNDPDERVRNNVIRVMGLTMNKSRITSIDPNPFIQLLNSPYTTDRNKALFVLITSAETKENKTKIIQTGGNSLLALLQTTQPITHDGAYILLKKLSGHDFGEASIDAWRQWLTEQMRIPA